MIAFLFALTLIPAAQADTATNASASVEYADTASYEVPVPEELKPFATLTVPFDTKTSADGTTTIRYALPDTLTGATHDVVLSGQVDSHAPTFSLHGDSADMNCTNVDSKITCQVANHGIVVDVPAVQKALDASSLSSAEKQGRLMVASFLSRQGGDLMGIVRYRN